MTCPDCEELRREVERLQGIISRNRERFDRLIETAQQLKKDRDFHRQRADLLKARLVQETGKKDDWLDDGLLSKFQETLGRKRR